MQVAMNDVIKHVVTTGDLHEMGGKYEPGLAYHSHFVDEMPLTDT